MTKNLNELTQEEYDLLLAENENLRKLETMNKDLEAERDSFKDENNKLKKDYEKMEEALKEAKKLNFTLARGNVSRETSEDALISLFGRKKVNDA